MKKIIGYLIISAAVVLSGIWVAAQVELTSFQPGEVIKAEEVNANFEAVASELNTKQARITGTCDQGSSIRLVNADGTVECEPDDGGPSGGGDITAVIAGTGLSGGGDTAEVTLTLDTGATDSRYVNEGEDDSITSDMAINESGYSISPVDGNKFDVTFAVQSFNSVTIEAPASGYVLVMGQADIWFEHTNGDVQNALVGVSRTVDEGMSGRLAARWSPNAPTGTWIVPASSQHVFQVSAGTHTFYLNAQDNFGGGPTGGISISSPQVTAVYLPTHY